jgi:hypothetical protein
MTSRSGRTIVGLVRTAIAELEAELSRNPDGTTTTRLAVSSLLIGLRLRLIFMFADDPDVFRTATTLDSRWRALLPEIERRRSGLDGDA